MAYAAGRNNRVALVKPGMPWSTLAHGLPENDDAAYARVYFNNASHGWLLGERQQVRVALHGTGVNCTGVN